MASFQVIDCLARKIVPLPPNSQYAALSYVWSSETPDSATKAARLHSFDHRPLPAVIEDAIKVTIGLGLRFIWVDRYCIP